jgi:rubrerythrin
MASVLRPLYWAVWSNPLRRARKLLQFAEVEGNGSRDLLRAAERTNDPTLRRRFLAHSRDEARHAQLFRTRGLDLCAMRPASRFGPSLSDWVAPGENGLEDVQIDDASTASLLAFIHLSESAAARDFAEYRRVLRADPQTSKVFEQVLRDEEFHMRYSLNELNRIAPGRSRFLLWKARLRRLWNAYLRLAMALAGAIAAILLTIQYFVLLPPFALAAKRSARRESTGWRTISPEESDLMTRKA